MSLKAQIGQDLKSALKAGDHLVCDTLRLLKAEISNKEIALGVREAGLDESQIEQVIAKEVKKRREAANMYADAERQELADKEIAEAEILQKYLPKQLGESEINQVIIEVVQTLGLEMTMANLGKIIGQVKLKAGSSADGGLIAKLVKDKLS